MAGADPEIVKANSSLYITNVMHSWIVTKSSPDTHKIRDKRRQISA